MALRVCRIRMAAIALPSTKAGHDGGSETGAPVLGERHIARGRQPAELDREQEDQHDPEPEIRRRDAPHARTNWRHSPRRCPSSPRRRCRAGMPIRNAITIAMAASCIVTGSFWAIRVRTGTLMRRDSAEVTRQHALDPVGVLNRDWLIEPVLMADLLDDCWIALLAGHDQRRIAGQQLLQREDQDRHEEQRRDELNQPTCQEAQHVAPSVSRPRSFQLQSDHADQPVGHLLVAFQSGGVRDQDPAVIEVEERFFVERGLCQLFIDRLALRLIRDEAASSSALSGLGIGPGAVVLAAHPCAGRRRNCRRDRCVRSRPA